MYCYGTIITNLYEDPLTMDHMDELLLHAKSRFSSRKRRELTSDESRRSNIWFHRDARVDVLSADGRAADKLKPWILTHSRVVVGFQPRSCRGIHQTCQGGQPSDQRRGAGSLRWGAGGGAAGGRLLGRRWSQSAGAGVQEAAAGRASHSEGNNRCER